MLAALNKVQASLPLCSLAQDFLAIKVVIAGLICTMKVTYQNLPLNHVLLWRQLTNGISDKLHGNSISH